MNQFLSLGLEALCAKKIVHEFIEEQTKFLNQQYPADALGQHFQKSKSTLAFQFTGVLGVKIYELLHSQAPQKKQSTEIIKRNILYATLNDRADNIIDQEKMTPKESQQFLESIMDVMFEGRTKTTTDIERKIVLSQAEYSYQQYHKNQSLPSLKEIYERTVIAIIEESKNTDLEQSIDHAIEVGGCCFLIPAVIAQYSQKSNDKNTIHAIYNLGGYLKLLDDMIDLNEDLKNNTPTYPVLKIKEQGNTPKTRQEIMITLEKKAEKLYQEGLSHLKTQHQKEIYTALKQWIDLKHYVFDRAGNYSKFC